MHRLLKRQLKLSFGKEFDTHALDDNVQDLIERMNEKYYDMDKERKFLENTIHINSEELMQAYDTISSHNKELKHKVTEKELLLQQYKDAIDTTLIVSKCNTDFILTYANDQFIDLTTYNTSDILGQKHPLIHPDFMKKNKFTHMNKSLQNAEIWSGRIEASTYKGEDYVVDTTIFPIVNADAKINEYMILEHDISEIFLAREIAESSIEAKSQFMASMSHEIRTPMNSIMGFATLLSQTTLNHKQKNYINLMQNSMKSLLEITNDILDFSKIESGHLSLDYTDVNIFTEVNETISMFAPKCRDKDISYQIHIDTHISECVQMDKLRITQVLNNLISNALKFTPQQGTISVDILQLNKENDSETIRFSVSDTGIGIPQDRLDKIFQSFIQADNSTTRKFGGTGLGLSISKSICQLMDSNLQVISKEGQGSTFYFDVKLDACHTIEKLSMQLKHQPVYILEEESKIYHDVITQLKHFNIKYEKINHTMLQTILSKQHIVILFNTAYIQQLQPYSSHLILIEENSTEESCEQTDNLFHIDNFFECPSTLYNVLLNYAHDETDNLQTDYQALSLSVLVAEDYEINRILIDEMLKSFGLEADFAHNGAQAVNISLEKEYDLILMDINMPELNGIEATDIIHQHNPTIPIIALTANALEGDKEYYLSKGFNNYISKPIDMEILYQMLLKYHTKAPDLVLSAKTIRKNTCTIDSTVLLLEQAKTKMQFSSSIIKRLFDSFIKSAHETSQKMEEANAVNDIDVIQKYAHAIRGSALSLKFNKIGEICHQLEYETGIDYTALIKELCEIIEYLYSKKEEIQNRFD